MKWRQSVPVVLIIAFFAIFSSTAFGAVKKFTPVKSGIEEALEAFVIARNASANGNIFQRNKKYEEAVQCYATSLRLWRNEDVYFNLAYCLLVLKEYEVAEWSAVCGLEMSSHRGDFINLESFIVLLGNIYYESGNMNKARDAYNFALRLPLSEAGRYFVEERMENLSYENLSPILD